MAKTRDVTTGRATRTKEVVDVRSEPLAAYRAKRDFEATPEPTPDVPKECGPALAFVVQKHDARRLHYDLRLQIGDAMMSWAIPKGPSYDPSVKRLAVETEDHPLAYNDFEGHIPDGNYGAGDVLIWDEGTYQTVPPGSEVAMRDKGHLHVRLFGQKLVGEWHLVRTKGVNEKTPSWLFFKARDGWAHRHVDIVREAPGSVRKTEPSPPPAPSSSPFGLLRRARPLAPVVTIEGDGDLPLDLARYTFEFAYRGLRTRLAAKKGELLAEPALDEPWLARLRPILDQLPVREVVLDVVCGWADARGVPQDAPTPEARPMVAVIDLLWLDGRDCAPLAIEERRALLASLLSTRPSLLIRSSAVAAPLDPQGRPDLSTLRSAVRVAGLERLIAKPVHAPYPTHLSPPSRPEPATAWYALPCSKPAGSTTSTEAESTHAPVVAPAPADPPSSRGRAPRAGPRSHRGVSNPGKVLFPRDGMTKAEIVGYYEAFSDVLLPHLAGRPVGLQRWPDGIDGESWFQQHPPQGTPADFPRIVFDRKTHIFIWTRDQLRWFANLAALTLHNWSSHVPAPFTERLSDPGAAEALRHPDRVILDLDPGDGSWADLIRVAAAVRVLLEKLELPSVVKTSGKRGLHVVIPVAATASHPEGVRLGEVLATAVARALPDIATVERMRDKRRGRLYVDYLQNGEGKTIVAPYSVRAVDGAPVSMPIDWSEVTERLSPADFTIRTARQRVDRMGDLFAPVLSSEVDVRAVLSRLEGTAMGR